MGRKILCLVVLAALLAVAVPAVAVGVPVKAAETTARAKSDNRSDPLTNKQLALREVALEKKLNGHAYGKVAEVARGQFVELAREGEGMIWTVLGEFSDLAHNELPEPDRAVDNSTIWVPDFSRDYYMDTLFADAPGANSMRTYYIEQSSNRYTVDGDVTDWVTCPGTAASYDDSPDANVWNFLVDSVDGWYAAQIADGKTPAEIDAYLAQFDVWDRYDYDFDGDYNEPDGYIDTFQSVHAGLGEEGGGEAWAIWSHSWYAYSSLIGIAGPSFNPSGGFQVGDSSYWVGKYTIQPENGGVGVFTHEYAHDMGLPDLYDYYGENGTGFWTLMSSGSWLDEGLDTIGNKPSHMGAWEKFQLGWLKYEVARAGVKSQHKLGPMEFTSKQAQGLFVILPPKQVTTTIASPYAGSYFYYSGTGDERDNVMYKSFVLPPAATLTAKVQYSIELDWDYAYVVVSDDGVTWTPVETNLSTGTSPNGQNFGHGITGSTGGAWIDLTADLSAYEGAKYVGFRYWTDAAYNEAGFMADEITISGSATDGAEAAAGWTFAPASGGFRVTNGTESASFNHYYVAEYRTYKGYDSTLKVGPYYFGYLDDPVLANFVDHFAYQDGMLVNYWDTSQGDNNTGLHPGQGLLLTVDAHPTTLYRVDGGRWRNRIQTYDSTFGLEATDGIPNIHHLSVLSPVASLPAVAVFNDTRSWYDPTNPLGSVMTPNTGTKISVTSVSARDGFMQVQVAPAK